MMTVAQRDKKGHGPGVWLPNNNKKALVCDGSSCERKMKGTLGSDREKSSVISPSFTKAICGITDTRRGRQMAQRRDSIQTGMKEGHKESEELRKKRQSL